MNAINLTPKIYDFFKALLPENYESYVNRADTICLGVCDEDGLCIGALCSELLCSELQVTHLFVAPEHRERGAGSALLSALNLACMRHSEISKIVLDFESSKSSAELAEFLRHSGFSLSERDSGGRLTSIAELAESAFWKETHTGEGCCKISSVDSVILNRLSKAIRKSGMAAISLPIDFEAYEQDLSMVCFDRGELCGLALVSFERSILILSYVHLLSSHSGHTKSLLYNVGKAAIEKYPKDCEVFIGTVGQPIQALVERLVPTAKVILETHAEIEIYREEV